MATKKKKGLDKRRLGKCYENAGRALLHNKFGASAVLVHGSIGPNYNPHAWVEYSEEVEFSNGQKMIMDFVYEPTSDESHLFEVFYFTYFAIAHNRYTFEQMGKKMMAAKHWGPWEGDYWKMNGKTVEAIDENS